MGVLSLWPCSRDDSCPWHGLAILARFCAEPLLLGLWQRSHSHRTTAQVPSSEIIAHLQVVAFTIVSHVLCFAFISFKLKAAAEADRVREAGGMIVNLGACWKQLSSLTVVLV